MSTAHRYGLIVVLATLLGALLAGCSASKRAIEPPVVRVSALESDPSGQITLDLVFTNLNAFPLNATQINIGMHHDGMEFVDWQQTTNWSISPNATEVVMVRSPIESNEVLQRLTEVTQGERISLSYELIVEVVLGDERRLEMDLKGFLYRVPGQPGRFR